jgi:two-component system, OmpR family, alkaline phosphatase synthesis response regulator PhoP
MSTVLVIEDDPNLAFVLKDNLEFEGHAVVTVADGAQGLERAVTLRPDLVILDVMLPGMNGIQVCKSLRERGEGMPVMLLTARSQEAEKVQGLDAGADDYVTKPFGVQELLARVRVLLRRTQHTAARERLERYSFAHVEIDFKSFRATRAGKKLPLSQREIELLRCLIERKGEPVPRATLLREVWSAKDPPSARAVDVHVTHLRNKLGSTAARHIVTVHGVGYTFVES